MEGGRGARRGRTISGLPKSGCAQPRRRSLDGSKHPAGSCCAYSSMNSTLELQQRTSMARVAARDENFGALEPLVSRDWSNQGPYGLLYILHRGADLPRCSRHNSFVASTVQGPANEVLITRYEAKNRRRIDVAALY